MRDQSQPAGTETQSSGADRKEATELGAGLWGGEMPGWDSIQFSHTRAMLPHATLPPGPASSGRGLRSASEPGATQSISVFRTDVRPVS